MFEVKTFSSLIVIFSVTILYAFAYIEILFIVHKIFYKEKHSLSPEFMYALFGIPLLLFLASYFARTSTPSNLQFDLFFVSLGLFFTSVVLFALGLIVRGIWEQKIREMNIKLLSRYSVRIIHAIYLIAVVVCFLLALVSLIEYIEVVL